MSSVFENEFRASATKLTVDLRHRALIRGSLKGYEKNRDTPHLRGLQDWKRLSSASSLCGACSEICPVKINLHHHLLHNRRNAAKLATGRLDQTAFGAFALLVNHPKIFVKVAKIARILQPLHRIVAGAKIDPLLAWTRSREAPVIAKTSFRQYWKSRQR
jgi:L-lactate dehydrogenase complex protein LldF